MKKYFILILLIISLVSCSENNKAKKEKQYPEELIELIHNLEYKTPIDIRNVGALHSIKLNTKDDRIEFFFSIPDELFANFENGTIIKTATLTLLSTIFDYRTITEIAVKEDIPILLVFENESGSKKSEHNISDEELQKLLKEYPDDKSIWLELIKIEVETLNDECPEPWDEGFCLTSVSLINKGGQNYINYDYEIDEENYELLMIDELRDEFKEVYDREIETLCESENIIQMILANCGYRYRFYSEIYPEEFIFIYSAQELSDNIKNPELLKLLKEF